MNDGGAMTAGDVGQVRYDVSWLGEQDVYLFNEGTHLRIYDKLGAHPATVDGVAGTHFAVWAPNAVALSVIGSFNGWSKGRHPLRAVDVQVPRRVALRGLPGRQGGPVRLPRRASAGDRLAGVAARLRMG
jgi:hypothetical protein